MIDITRTLSADTPVWPGDRPVRLVRDRWSESGPNVSFACMTLHAGTHADAPLHYDAGAADCAGLDMTRFIGPCHVLELDTGQPCVQAGFFDGLPEDAERVLIKTPASFLNGQAYIMSRYGLTHGAAKRLMEKGIRLVGVDGPTVGVEGEEGDAVHRTLLASGVAVVEGLDLSEAAEGRYLLCSLPLKIGGGEASPLRALLFPPEEGV